MKEKGLLPRNVAEARELMTEDSWTGFYGKEDYGADEKVQLIFDRKTFQIFHDEIPLDHHQQLQPHHP